MAGVSTVRRIFPLCWKSLQALGPRALVNLCILQHLNLGMSLFGMLFLNCFTCFHCNNGGKCSPVWEAQLHAPGGWCPFPSVPTGCHPTSLDWLLPTLGALLTHFRVWGRARRSEGFL